MSVVCGAVSSARQCTSSRMCCQHVSAPVDECDSRAPRLWCVVLCRQHVNAPVHECDSGARRLWRVVLRRQLARRQCVSASVHACDSGTWCPLSVVPRQHVVSTIVYQFTAVTPVFRL